MRAPLQLLMRLPLLRFQAPAVSRNQSVFSGLVAQRVTSPSESLGLLRTGQFLLDQPFQLSTLTRYSRFFGKCSDPDHNRSPLAERHRRTTRRHNPEFGGVSDLGTQPGSRAPIGLTKIECCAHDRSRASSCFRDFLPWAVYCAPQNRTQRGQHGDRQFGFTHNLCPRRENAPLRFVTRSDQDEVQQCRCPAMRREHIRT